jgi:hypothetical protein
MTPTGAELPTDLPKETTIRPTGGANYGAHSGDDRELSFVVERWPLLSAVVREEICRLAAGE